MPKTMADVHAAISDLEDMFQGAGSISADDARMCVQDMRTVFRQMSHGVANPNKGASDPLRFPEAFDALLIVDRIERAISVKDFDAGMSACGELRALGSEHGWMGFA